MKFYIIFSIAFQIIYSLDNGLGKTPQMGWNTWNKFGCNINEELIILILYIKYYSFRKKGKNN